MEENSAKDSSSPVPGTSKCNNEDFDTSSGNSRPAAENTENYTKEHKDLESKYFENKIEKKLFEKCVLNAKVAEFLHDKIFYPCNDSDDEDDTIEHSISQEDKLYIKQLLEEKEEMNKKALKISIENKDLDRKVMAKRVILRELMQKRKPLWNEAVKIYENLRRGPEYEKIQNNISLGLLSMNNSVDDAEFKLMNEEIAKKMNRIRHLSRVLHLLISFSGATKWAHDKSLLEIVLCTGKVLNCDLNVDNQIEFEKVLDDVIHKLNFVKI